MDEYDCAYEKENGCIKCTKWMYGKWSICKKFDNIKKIESPRETKMNNETKLALLELEHRYGKEVRDRVEQMGLVIPTVNAVEVVRCKDCVILQYCRFAQGLGLDGFCSQGGRKNETD